MRYPSGLLATPICLAVLASAGSFGAEDSPPPAAPIVDQRPQQLAPLYQRLAAEGKRSEVLNLMEIGTAALFYGDTRDAEQNFDSAEDSIEAIWSNTDSAIKARSLWYNEDVKDFKGEPYERLMVYYYRGLLFLAKDDYQNAAATFKAGLLQDAFAEEEQNRANFALLMFLHGWSQQCESDDKGAADSFAEARQFRPDYNFPKPDDKVLVVLETGRSPRKVSDGIGHGELKFRRGRNFTEVHAQLVAGSSTIDLYPMEDIYLKASTRGGRPVDAIIRGKVRFREAAEDAGGVLSDASRATVLSSAAFTGAARGTGEAVGGSLALLSVIGLAAAANAGTHADTRYWGGLPDAVHVTTVSGLPDGPLSAAYLDAAGNRVADPDVESSVQKFGNRCTLIWGRSRRPEPAPPPLE